MLSRLTHAQIAAAWAAIAALAGAAGWWGHAHTAALLGWISAPTLTAAGAVFAVLALLGVPWGVTLLLRRDTEQRTALRNLSEAMEQSLTAVMIVDMQSGIEYANRGLCEQIGYTRRELLGRNWRDFRVDDTPPEVVADLVTTVRAGRAWTGDWFNRRKDGSVYPVRGVVSPVRNADGGLACFIAVFEDMTEIRRTEAVLREAKERAEAGDRAKSQFLATMSHEVRTPLNGIVGFTSLLLETPLTAEQRDYVATIRTSGESLISLTSDILDFARIESGKLKLDAQPCDPRECVEEVLDLFAGAAAAKGLELLHRVDDAVPALVLADSARLRQVLGNLVNNAIKFTERGEVEVGVALGTEPVGAGAVRLACRVRDTGIGIAAASQGKLFRPFTQVDESTTRRYGGTGLGLAICRNLIGLMDGTIALESELRRGTTVRFTVRVETVATAPEATRPLAGLKLALAAAAGPLRDELAGLLAARGAEVTALEAGELPAAGERDFTVADVDEALAREILGGEGPLRGVPIAKLVGLVPLSLTSEQRAALRPYFRFLVNKPVHHGALCSLLAAPAARAATVSPFVPAAPLGLAVLVAEDNAVNQRYAEKALVALGCRATLAGDGRAAVEALARAAHDVVLMDLHMPEMDGLEAIRRIREGEAGETRRRVWIAALTADARDEQRARALAAGADDYLTKPLKLPALAEALRKAQTGR